MSMGDSTEVSEGELEWMEDEDVDPSVIRRILNRMVFGAPTGSESYERIGNEKVMLDMLMKATPQSLSVLRTEKIG